MYLFNYFIFMKEGVNFEFKYVGTKKDLESEIKKREQGGIPEKVRKYLIDNFGFDVDESKNPNIFENDSFDLAVLYRQFGTSNKEQVIIFIINEIMGFHDGSSSPIFTYVKDQYKEGNPFKRSIAEINDFKTGKIIKLGNPVEDQILSDITIEVDGKEVPAIKYHSNLLDECGYPNRHPDVSPLFSEFLSSSLQNLNNKEIKKKFNKIFVIKKDGDVHIRKLFKFESGEYIGEDGTSFTKDEIISLADNDMAYPTAISYYTHLLPFLPGGIFAHGQYVTPFEEDDEKIRNIAKKGCKKVKKVTGEFPLWVRIPNFSEPYHHIFEEKEALVDEVYRKLRNCIENPRTPIYKLAKKIDEVIYEYVRNDKKD